MQSNKKFNKKSEMIMYFLKGCKRYFALAVLFALLLVIIEQMNPKIIGYTIDFIIGDEGGLPDYIMAMIGVLGGREYVLSHLYLLSLVVVVIAIVGAFCRFMLKYVNAKGAENLVKNMRDKLYEHIIHLPFSWHDMNKTGDIIQRCTSDVDMIKNFISEQLLNLTRIVVMISVALFFMIRIHVVLGLIAFAFVPFVVGFSYLFHEKIGNAFEKCDNQEGKISAIAQENLTGVRVVRAFGRESYERERFTSENEVYTKLWIKMMRILAWFWTYNDFIRGVETIIIISLGAYYCVKGEISAGSYVALMSYNHLMTFPLARLGRVISEMSKANVSMERIMYIMNSEEEKEAADAVDFPGLGDIEFKNVSFEYETTEGKGVTVLDDINLKISKGQTVGILGGTGSGKSTIIQLLDGLYEVEKGNIYINGVDVSKIKKSELRKNIGLVLQEPYLFSRTLEENIKLAVDDASHEDVEKVVGIASLASSIAKFKEGYNTAVGERGVTLSGGQKQRTAISQMLITNPPIMIFDDSLSAVDATTDAKIRAALKTAGKDATVILISHRITTIMSADNIFVVDEGRVVESGSHDELVQKGGIYNKIFDMQRAAGEEE